MKIVLGNVYSRILDHVDDEDKARLREAVSYRPPGYNFSPKFQRGEWDGRITLFKPWDRSFPTGLFSIVAKTLKEAGHEVRVMDVRKRPEGIMTGLGDPIALRDYQEPAVKDAIEIGRGILNLPTASGKTLIAAAIMQQLRVKTLFVVHTKVIMDQSIDVFHKTLGKTIGQIGDGVWEPREITVAMVQSLTEPKDMEALREFDCIIVDEVHHIGNNSWFDCLMYLPAYFRFGLTGTSFRTDGASFNLMALTGRVIHKISTTKLIDEGYLVRPEIAVVDMTDKVSGFDYKAEYDLAIVENDYRNKCIAQIALELMKAGTVLIMVKLHEHGNRLLSLIPGAEFMSGKTATEKRREGLQRFKDGTLRCIIATTIFDEGLDVVNLHAVVMAGSGKSDIKTIQRIGRALRPAAGKKKAVVVDFNDIGSRKMRPHSNKRMAAYKREEGFVVEKFKTVEDLIKHFQEA